MTDIAAVAKTLEEGFSRGAPYEGLVPHLAETVDIVHHPDRSPNDGPTPRETVIRMFREGPNGLGSKVRQTLKRLAVDGERISAEQDFSVDLNGKTFDIPLTQVFTFRDGAMVGLGHYPDPAASREFQSAMRDAGAAAQSAGE